MKPSSRISAAMERTGQWVFSNEIPTDVVVVVGEANFSLHKFMLIAKSGYVRKLAMESDVNRIDLSDIPGGPEAFQKAAKFCYAVNFEITVHNVAALRCAAEFLEMTEDYCEGNLAERAEDFMTCAALTTFSGALAVLKWCEGLGGVAEDLKIVQRCVDVLGLKICNEANFPSRSPADWWAAELCVLQISVFQKIVTAMKLRGAKTQTIAAAVITYAEKSLPDLVRDQSGSGIATLSSPGDGAVRKAKRTLLESFVSLLPAEKAALPIGFLCCLLRAAIFLNASVNCKNDLEKRVAAILEHVMVGDLLVLSFTYDGERLFDLDSVRRIIAGFVEREKNAGVFGGAATASLALQRVAKTVDAYLAEVAADGDLSISKFTGIANLVPKAARKVEDDLYRAVDIFLKAHPGLDEIEREKACSVMDPLKLSYEARLHASQNKRLPVQVVLHAHYYDQLKLRSGSNAGDHLNSPNAIITRHQIQADSSLIKENEALRSELTKMKLVISDIQRNTGPSIKTSKKPTFLSSMSKTLGKLNPFRYGSKDTTNIEDSEEVAKPRRRRFSIS
ncbi:root phototropism protein 2-like [Aristolochia californica]|uniref:root phototropism protein 2-like n=1 Tax=Aristolochia californica TaxID=171875 RepID=UPI0035E278E8